MSTDGIKHKLAAVESDIARNEEKIKQHKTEEQNIKDKINDLTAQLRGEEGKRQGFEREGTKLIERKHQVEAELQRAEKAA